MALDKRRRPCDDERSPAGILALHRFHRLFILSRYLSLHGSYRASGLCEISSFK